MPDPEASSVRIGTAHSRVDGRLRVTGRARYGADFPASRPAFAYLRTSAIALGRVAAIDEAEARSLPGVLDVLTHRNVGAAIRPVAYSLDKGYLESTDAPLASERVAYAGQIVALVVAETFEVARDAAGRLAISYEALPPSATLGDAGITFDEQGDVRPEFEDPAVGDAEAAFVAAPAKFEARYETPPNHHNPIEMFSTTCAWDDDRLTIWEGCRRVGCWRHGVAGQLGIPPEKVRVISPFIGGAFGSRGFLSQRTAIVALAARRLGRPVKLVVPRSQMYTVAGFRSETRHLVKLAADEAGKFLALVHHSTELSSRSDAYMTGGTQLTGRLYACENVATRSRLARADRATPGFMRAPPAQAHLFALESAVDELSYRLGMDPVELRRANDTMTDPTRGRPYTSRNLMSCFDAAAAAFGWSGRSPEPASMRDGDWLVGYGCAAACTASHEAPATARVVLDPDGGARVRIAAHDVGGGLTTILAMTASDRLGVPIGRVVVEVGDSDLPPGPAAGGSCSSASACNVVAIACDKIRDRLFRAAVEGQDGPFRGRDPGSLRLADGRLRDDADSEPIGDAVRRGFGGGIEMDAEYLPHGIGREGLHLLHRGVSHPSGGFELEDRVQCGFGAGFVEVRVHAITREVRVARVVGAYSFGTVLNPKAARSQLIGGQIFGISAALHEATEIDRRLARYTNDDLADYLIPVHADVPDCEAIILAEEDRAINPLGIKGVGELANTGMNAAVANAVFHATGVRVRSLPIRLEHLLPAE